MLATPDMDTEGKWSHLSSNERDLILEESGEMALCCVIVTITLRLSPGAAEIV